MKEDLPKSVVWLKRVVLLQLISNAVYVLFLIYLAFAQPVDGWRSGIQLGFLEGLKGFQKNQEVVFFTAEEAVYLATPSFVSLILNAVLLRMIKKKNQALIKGTVLFKILYAVVNRAVPIFEIAMLVLIFNKNSRAFFKEKIGEN